MNDTHTAPSSTWRLSARRLLVTAGAIGALTAGGVAVAGSASAAEPAAASTSSASTASLLPGWCVFGTHHGPGSGCRGGSINDNERLNRALSDTGQMYRDATECALFGVTKGMAEGEPLDSFGAAAECGSDKPEGQF